jgi:uncharacterized membrane protein
MNPYDRPIIVQPRAFYLRIVTGMITMFAIGALFVSNYLKAMLVVNLSHVSWNDRTFRVFVFTLFYTAAFAGVASGVALALKRWAWETVYVIVGTLRLQGRQGVVIPAGTRFSSGENEFITTHENMIGASGFSDVEICTRWSQPYKKV